MECKEISRTCEDCNTELPLKVLRSAAGHYLGYWCPNCGPYSRMSSYYDKEDAEFLLKRIKDDVENSKKEVR